MTEKTERADIFCVSEESCNWAIGDMYIPANSGVFKARGGYDYFEPGVLFNTFFLLVQHHLNIRQEMGAGHEDYEARQGDKVVGTFEVHAYRNGSEVEYKKV